MSFTTEEPLPPPLVSVIVPIYNTEPYLKRCVDSILRQTFSDYEVILVNDGSTDRSLDICIQYAHENEKITVVNKENGGLSSARLAGFNIAKGKYILFVDSDDYIHEDMIRLLVDSMETTQSDLTMCGYYEKRGDEEKEIVLPFHEQVIQERKIIVEKYIKRLISSVDDETSIPGFMCIRLMKRDLIQREYFQSERKYYLEDHVFDLLYADQIQSISIVHAPLYYYCVNNNSLTNQHREKLWWMFDNLYHFYLSYIQDRKIEDCERRLNRFLLSAFCSSVDNAVLSGTYQHYKEEIKQIPGSTQLKKRLMEAVQGKRIPKTYRITYTLYRFRVLLLLFHVRKARLKR